MLTLTKLIGVFIVSMGAMIMLKPETMKHLITFLQQGRRLYILGLVRILLGIILILAASECRLVEVVVVLGILVLIKGFIIFIIVPEKINAMLNWWANRPSLILRFLGLFVIAIGALLVYSV